MYIHPVLSAKLSEANREFIPVIIYAKNTIREMRSCITANFGQIKYELPFINAVAVEAASEKIYKIAENRAVALIADDAVVSKAALPPAPDLLSEGGYLQNSYSPSDGGYPEDSNHDFLYYAKRGRNVGVAVIDTGVSPHYDLVRPVNRIIAFKDLVGDREFPYDDDGHGTHVAGIIAGNGYSSHKYIGTAPCSNIVAIKALDHSGNGNTSDILAALQWIINNKKRYNIRVVNLSLGVPVENGFHDDPLVKGAGMAVRYGLTVICAAGNSGPGRCTINSPGTSPYVITVGAAEMPASKKNFHVSVASFSSRGPTFSGLVKPDLLAPGVNIWSLDSKNPKGYLVQSGTSMAAPAVSGVAACLYGMQPGLTPVQVKKLLLRSTTPLRSEDRYAQGHGLLNYEIFI